jgi:hypothetical protein
MPEFSGTFSPGKRPRRAISISTIDTSEGSLVFSEIERLSTPATLLSDPDATLPGEGVAIHSSDHADATTVMLSDDAETCCAGTCFDNETSHETASVVPTIVSDTISLGDENYKQVAQAAVTLSEFQQAFGIADQAENVQTDRTESLAKTGSEASGPATQTRVSAALVGVPIQIINPILVTKLLLSCLLSLVIAVALGRRILISKEVPTSLKDGVASAFAERFAAARSVITHIIGSSAILWLAFHIALALPVWVLMRAVYTLAKAPAPQPCVERRVLPLQINGILIDAWPDTAGVNTMSKAAVNTFQLEVDTKKARILQTGLKTFHRTYGQVRANVAFAGYSQVQEVTFDVLSYWVRGLPEVTVGERFLDENNLLNTQDPRYASRPCTLSLYLVLLMDTTVRQKLRFLPISIMLSSCRQQVDALLDSGCTWDGMSLEYAAHHFPIGIWRHHLAKYVRCPDGTTIRTKWSVDATIQVGGQSINRTFYIVPRLTRNVILGHDFWFTYNPTEKYRDLISAIEDQDSETEDHLPMIQVGRGNGWLLRIGRKIGSSFGGVQAMTGV